MPTRQPVFHRQKVFSQMDRMGKAVEGTALGSALVCLVVSDVAWNAAVDVLDVVLTASPVSALVPSDR